MVGLNLGNSRSLQTLLGSGVWHDTDTCNYNELCDFFQLLAVSVSVSYLVSVSVLHMIRVFQKLVATSLTITDIV